MKLLLIEDDCALHETLNRALTQNGWEVEVCADGRAALGKWRKFEPDVVLLDLSLPGRDGLHVLEQARSDGLTTPVLILTARGTVGDRVLGLKAGADDYLPKPFDLDELEARINALYRRRNALAHDNSPQQLHCGPLRLDRKSGAFYFQHEILELAPRESALLQALIVKPGHAVAKERLFSVVFPGELEVHYEAIEVVVYRLRKKLQGTGVALVTLRGLGYLLKAPN